MGTYRNQTAGTNQIEVFPLTTQILSLIFSVTGFVLSVIAVSGCHFFEVSSSGDLDSSLHLYGGLFKYDRIGSLVEDPTLWNADCTSYPTKARDWDIDELLSKYPSYSNTTYGYTDPSSIIGSMIPTPHRFAYTLSQEPSFKAAKAMGAFCALVAGLTMVACLSMLFLRLPRCAFKTLSGCFFFCFVMQLLTLLVLDNDACNGTINEKILTTLEFDVGLTCDLLTDAKIAITAGVLFLAMGVTILVCPTPKNSIVKTLSDSAACHCCEEGKYGGQQISPGSVSVPAGNEITNTTETYNRDGSITVKQERINPDGTRSITMTTRNASSI